MALPKSTKRIIQATAGTLAGAATLIGGRAAYKRRALPSAQASEKANRAFSNNLPKPKIPKTDLPKLNLRRSNRPTVIDTYTLDGENVRILEVGKVYQSVSYVEPDRKFDLVLEYYRAFDNLFEFGPKIDSVLTLGAGGCSFPKHAAYCHPDVRVDAVEADPEIARIAHEKFFIDELPCECQFQLHECDALDYLLSCQEQGLRYSAVVNDCFDGKDADEGLLSPESLQLTKTCMQPGGLYLLNTVSKRNGRNLSNVRAATKALRKAFAHVYVFPCTDAEMGGEDNYVLFATDGTYKIER